MKNRAYIYVVSVEIVRSVMKKRGRDRMGELAKRRAFDITKEHLTRYPFYIATIKRNCRKIHEIREKLEGFKGTDYSKDRVSGTPADDIKTTLLDELLQLDEQKDNYNKICLDLDEVVNALPEPEKTIIEMYYRDTKERNKRTWIAIAYAVNHHHDHCRKLRNKAIEKISVIFDR